MKKGSIAVIIFLFVVSATVLHIYSISDRAEAAVGIGITNELIDPDNVDNFGNPDGNGNRPKVGDKGYMVVGTGDYPGNSVILSFTSETSSITLDIEHAGICQTSSSGAVGSVDDPNGASNPETTFNFYNLQQTNPNFDFKTTRSDCNSGTGVEPNGQNRINRRVTVSNLRQFSSGGKTYYGGGMNVVLSANGSQQNSFRVLGSRSTDRVAYDKGVADFVQAALGVTTTPTFAIANTDLPKNGISNFSLNVAIDCNTVNQSETGKLGFFDVDHNVWQNINGSNGRGTYNYPTLRFELWEKDSGSSNSNYRRVRGPVDITGGDDVWDETSVGDITFQKNKDYDVRVLGLSRPNAVVFRVTGIEFSQTAHGRTCDNPPTVCNSFSNLVAPAGEYAQVSFNIRNVSNFNWSNGGSTANPTYDIGVVDTSFSGSKQNGAATQTPSQGGAGPPDFNSDTYLENRSGTNNRVHSVDFRRNNRDESVIRYGTSASIPAGGSRNFSVWVKVPDTPGQSKEYGIRMLSRDARFAPYAWLNWSDTCEFEVQADPNVAPTGSIINARCDVSRNNRATGTISARYSVRDTNGDNLTIRLISPTPSSGRQTVTNNNGSTGTRTGDFTDFNVNRGATYTLDGDVFDGTARVGFARVTVSCSAPPNATCSIGRIFSAPPATAETNSANPLDRVTVEVDIDAVTASGTDAWPSSTSTRGLRAAVATRGVGNWGSNGASVNPSPDRGGNGSFSALGAGGGQSISNVTYYDVTESGVSGRYRINNPTLAGNSTIRVEVPRNTGEYTMVIRLYDQAAGTWLSNRCQTSTTNPFEVVYAPLTCDIGSLQGVEVNSQFRTTAPVQNPNSVEVPILVARYSSPDKASYNGDASDRSTAAANTYVSYVSNNRALADGTTIFRSTQLTADETGEFGINWQIQYDERPGVRRTVNCNNGVAAEQTVSILPYAKLYGNDIFAGGGFGRQCSLRGGLEPRAVGYASYSEGFSQGSSAELAIFAVENIRGIRPGSAAGTTTAIDEISRLAFSNDGSVDGVTVALESDAFGGQFGGGFGQTICSEDWWGNRDAAGALRTDISNSTINLSDAATNGQKDRFLVTPSVGPVTIYASSPIADGTSITIYVDGDVILGSDADETSIGYQNSSWTNVDDIPGIFIIARGNIYVNNAIEDLNGVFVAQPNEETDALYEASGEIHTCYNREEDRNLVEWYAANPSAAGEFLAGQCNRKLTITGSALAKNIELLRTIGTVSSAEDNETERLGNSNNVAEVFRFNPLLYTNRGAGVPRSDDTTNVVEFESILSLPPAF